MLTRIRTWLTTKLGGHYAAVIETLDRGVVVFATACASKALLSGFGVASIVHLSWWATVGGAGVAAVAAWAQGLLTTWSTGSPAVLSLVSPTLRARRDTGRPVLHQVPVRKPRRKAAA